MSDRKHGFDQPTISELPAILPDYCGHKPEPLQQIRPIVGPVMSAPCGHHLCPGLTVLGDDDDDEPDLMTVLESYRGCVIRVTIELVEGPRR